MIFKSIINTLLSLSALLPSSSSSSSSSSSKSTVTPSTVSPSPFLQCTHPRTALSGDVVMCHVGPEDFGGCFEEPGSHGFANRNGSGWRFWATFFEINCRPKLWYFSRQILGRTWCSDTHRSLVGVFSFGAWKIHGKSYGKIHNLPLVGTGGKNCSLQARFSPSYGSSISWAFKKSWRRFDASTSQRCRKKLRASRKDQDSPGQSVKFQWLMICQWGIHIETKPYIWGTK